MQLDRIAVVLRPRNEWEALDLGFQMAREWWRPIWGVWLALYVPVGTVLLLAFDDAFHAVLALWWLKPLFDRAVLHAASRALFEEPCGVAATLKAAGQWLKPGLVGALTWRRFDLARSFTIPVSILEKQVGAAARRRRAALGARARGKAVWLTVVCLHIETIAAFGLVAIVAMLTPSATDLPQVDYGTDFVAMFRDLFTWDVENALYYMVSVTLVEPFYVTAGFALYLNRRTLLEGWDIEVQLRRMEARLRALAPATMALAVAVLCATTLIGGGAPATAFAQQDPTVRQMPATDAAQPDEPPIAEQPSPAPSRSAQEQIRKVLEDPAFGSSREVSTWRYVGERAKTRPEDDRKLPMLSEAWRNFLLLLADISQALMWVLAALVLLLILLALRRFMPEPRLRRPAWHPPETLFGLQVAPETLPDDVAAAALAAAHAGSAREALSLLYRGALSSLVHRHALSLQAGDTEGDCLRAASRVLPASGAAYFSQLVDAWQAAAYAGRLPALAGIERLCADWKLHFQKAAP